MGLRIAGLVGREHVGAMMDELSARDFALWVKFYEAEPWGYAASFYPTAVLGAALLNGMPLRGKDAPTITPADLLRHLKHGEKSTGRRATEDPPKPADLKFVGLQHHLETRDLSGD